MSDTGLYGSVYEQLRTYADRLDRSLIGLRNSDGEAAHKARHEIITVLREISDKNSTNPAARFVALVLRQDLPDTAGQGLSLCQTLAMNLEQRPPSGDDLDKLERIAITLDKECSSTLARIKGKR